MLSKFDIDADTMDATRYYIINVSINMLSHSDDLFITLISCIQLTQLTLPHQSCQGEYQRKNDVNQLLIDLNEGVEGIDDLRTLIDTDATAILDVCGVTQERLDDLGVLIDASYNAFADFVAMAEDNLDILECKAINDVFVDFYHDALCTSGPFSLMWIFATMMSVFVLGMAMILFRGALYPSNVTYDASVEEEEEESNTMKDPVEGAHAYDTDNDSSKKDETSQIEGSLREVSDRDEASQMQESLREASVRDEASQMQEGLREDTFLDNERIDNADTEAPRVTGYDLDNGDQFHEEKNL